MSNQDEGSGLPHLSPFEAIRRTADDGTEYWSARDLAKILGYTKWANFIYAINKAKEACENSGHSSLGHFAGSSKLIRAGKEAQRKIEDYQLSRYASYLIVQNADPNKPIVALGQTYFAVQTRRQEVADELTGLSEDQLRLLRRSQMSVYNIQLAEAAQHSGVVQPIDFTIFQDHGYMDLYDGLKAQDIHEHKSLEKNQEILDYMGSDELAANIFRASQTKQKLERERVQGKEAANRTHHEVGREVRKTIKRLGGTMPEDLPTPQESIQQLEKKEQRRLKRGPQLEKFDQLPEARSDQSES